MSGHGRWLWLPPLAAVAAYAPAQAVVYLTVEQAQRQMFGDQTLSPLPLVLSPEQIAAIERDSGVKVTTPLVRVWKATSGYFFADAVIGKHDLIEYAVGLDNDGRVRDVEILEYREAYGGQVRNAAWRAQFDGKRHGDVLRLGADIQGISGATLSCQHLTDGIRRLLATYAVAIAPR
jgi:Na+-translocating ferredoxin:NAD+ oxidoreductase RnfG subunit